MKYLIASQFRTTRTDNQNSFRVSFQEVIPKGRYRLREVYLPVQFYNVNSFNNKIYFFENAIDKTATLTSGYYDATTLGTVIKSVMDTASGGYNVYTVTYTASTQKFTITATNAFKFTFGTNITTSAGALLGFQDTATATSQTSASVVDLSYTPMVRIQIQQFDHSIVDSNFAQTTFSIPVSVNTQQVMIWTPTSQTEQIGLLGQSSRSLDVRLYDVAMNLLPNNSIDWYFVLEHCES
jgi:hypothetical protein